MSRRHLRILLPRGMLVGLMAAVLAACGWFSGAPEYRARDFLRSMVTEPDDTGRSAALLHPRVAEGGVLDTLSVRVAIDYLQAKHRQGVPLEFDAGNAEKRGDGRRVRITVIDQAEARHGAYDKIVFIVDLENSKSGWLVTRMQTHE